MIKTLLKEGFILKNKCMYKHSIECFYKALELDPSSLELLYEISELYYCMHNLERALGYLEQVLNKEPTHLRGLRLLQKIFIEKKAWSEAEQAAKNIYCISSEPDDLASIFKVLINQGRYEEISEYSGGDENQKVLYYRAKAKYLLKDCVAAEKYIDASIKIDTNKENCLLKGKILYSTNRYKEAEDFLEKIVQMDENNNAEFYNLKGLINQKQGIYEDALNCFKLAIKMDSDSDEYYYNCASTYFKMGKPDMARKFYNLSISKNPENQSYHLALANLYYSEKLYKRALEELNGDMYEARLLRAIIYYDSGYIAIAKKEFDKLFEERPQDELIIKYKENISKEFI